MMMRPGHAMVLALCLLALVPTCCSHKILSAYLSLTGDLSEMQLTYKAYKKPDTTWISYWHAGSSPASASVVNATADDVTKFKTPFEVTEHITSLTMVGLTSNTFYNYAIYFDGVEKGTYYFKTLPGDSDPVSMVMYGDLGSEGTALIETGEGGLPHWATNYKMDFIVHYGDLAYNLASNDGQVGDAFVKNIMVLSTKMPYLVLPGNHEYFEHKKNLALYEGWFAGQSKLGLSSGSTDPTMFYSYDVGEKLHMVAINTEVYCEAESLISAQWKWLVNDLRTVRARAVQPWIIVYGHRQMYLGTRDTFHSRLMRYGLQCDNENYVNCNPLEPCLSGKNCAYGLEDLFYQYNIDVYITGHKHSYVRMFPINLDYEYEAPASNNVYVDPQYPTYIVSGAPGNEHKIKNATCQFGDVVGPTVMWEDTPCFSYLQVFNKTHLHFQQIRVSTGAPMDDLWIVKSSSVRTGRKSATMIPFNMVNNTEKSCDQ